MTINVDELQPGRIYWAEQLDGNELVLVQISDVFGAEREYWSVARFGTDQHFAIEDFSFCEELAQPDQGDFVAPPISSRYRVAA
jgi:hypothetical protein